MIITNCMQLQLGAGLIIGTFIRIAFKSGYCNLVIRGDSNRRKLLLKRLGQIHDKLNYEKWDIDGLYIL